MSYVKLLVKKDVSTMPKFSLVYFSSYKNKKNV